MKINKKYPTMRECMYWRTMTHEVSMPKSRRALNASIKRLNENLRKGLKECRNKKKPIEFFESEEKHVNLQFDFQGYSFEQKKIIMDSLGNALKKVTQRQLQFRCICKSPSN